VLTVHFSTCTKSPLLEIGVAISSENPDDSCNVGHVAFGDQLIFGRTVCPTLSDHCLSVCPVCNLGVLWPNGRAWS